MNDQEVIDPRALARLQEWGGDKLLRELVRIFLDNSPIRVGQIRAAVDGGDIKDAERAAHSLKSSAANLGAERLRALASEVERTASSADLEATRDRLGELEGAWKRVVSALEDIEKGLST
jgi:HPt (histidine-containing phosphotransfer) domain-containing protein